MIVKYILLIAASFFIVTNNSYSQSAPSQLVKQTQQVFKKSDVPVTIVKIKPISVQKTPAHISNSNSGPVIGNNKAGQAARESLKQQNTNIINKSVNSKPTHKAPLSTKQAQDKTQGQKNSQAALEAQLKKDADKKLAQVTNQRKAVSLEKKQGSAKSAKMPSGKSQLNHIFDPKKTNEGHIVPKTEGSRSRAGTMFENVASDPKNGRLDLVADPNKRKAGIKVFTKEQHKGQVWVETRADLIQGAGVNRKGAYR